MIQRSEARAPKSFVEEVAASPLVRNKAVRNVLHPIRRKFDGLEALLRAKGLVIRPLVPEQELAACQRNAIQLLKQRDPGHVWGDYLEFGVFQGHSMSLMYRNLLEAGVLEKVRLFGFDSFEGYPKEASEELENEYLPGADKAEMHVAQKVLTRRGVDWNRVKLVKGWFSESLTPEFRRRENITRVSLANFDCDLYLSTAQALAFTAPLVQDTAVFFFDDWGGEALVNQKRAFVEYLEANPDIYAEEIPNYSWESRVFFIERRADARVPWQERLNMAVPRIPDGGAK